MLCCCDIVRLLCRWLLSLKFIFSSAPFNKELWRHAERFGWSMQSIHKHVYYLHAALANTKVTLEDVLCELADHQRESKNENSSVQRCYFYNCIARTLLKSEIPFMRLQQGDLGHSSVNASKKGVSFYPVWSGCEFVREFAKAVKTGLAI
jgi:hypothetical protein